MGSSNSNLFKNEEISQKILRIFIFTPVGFNSAKDIDPWHQSLLEIKNDKSFPEWVYEYY